MQVECLGFHDIKSDKGRMVDACWNVLVYRELQAFFFSISFEIDNGTVAAEQAILYKLSSYLKLLLK